MYDPCPFLYVCYKKKTKEIMIDLSQKQVIFIFFFLLMCSSYNFHTEHTFFLK